MSIYPSPTSFLHPLIRMLYLLDSSVKYIYMPFYPRVLVYQDKLLQSFITLVFLFLSSFF